jgi:hypothetical protein
MIGFVILSHRAPEQLLRLTKALNSLYASPKIIVHHDFGQSSVDSKAFPNNVHFCSPHIRTGWGKWSLVSASLLGISRLYADANPKYFYLLSAADYPIANEDQVRSDLSSLRADAYIDHFDLQKALDGSPEIGDPSLAHHRAPWNLHMARNRYLRAQIKVPIMRLQDGATSFREALKIGRSTIPLPFSSPWSPFDAHFRCHVGSQWFAGSSLFAASILAHSKRVEKLRKHYSSRIVPDESYFQTIAMNDPTLKVVNWPYRYSEWNGGGAHPKNLEMGDLENILRSGAHFARKFEQNSLVLDAIDHHLGISS